VAALAAGCPPNAPTQVPPGAGGVEPSWQPGPPDEAPSPGPGDPHGKPPPAGADPDADSEEILGAIGDPCNSGRDCESGTCEGMGCGEGEGRCVAADRACTMDIHLYCGCDGKSFNASGSCPGKRFRFRHGCDDKVAEGGACLDGAECASGVCEGQGCGPDQPGTCVPRARRCTKDLREYCGCDGQTFRGSGSCPGRRFMDRRACPAPTATPAPATPAPSRKAEGAACLEAGECASGICEGLGCGADRPGICAPAKRGCTRDLRPYCGCDGATFRASGSCPGRRFSAKAACP
jgi:hypothetical protein